MEARRLERPRIKDSRCIETKVTAGSLDGGGRTGWLSLSAESGTYLIARSAGPWYDHKHGWPWDKERAGSQMS